MKKDTEQSVRANPQIAEHTAAAASTVQEGAVRRSRKSAGSGFVRKIVLGVLLLFGAVIVGVAAMVAALFGRVSKSGTYQFSEESEAVAVAVPLPDNSPAVSVRGTLAVPPLPVAEGYAAEILPLNELYAQTELTEQQRVAIAAHNNSTAHSNILLVGVDRRGSSGRANADTIMIATLDKKNNRLKLTSIMRDTYVPIAGHNAGRINSAAAKGDVPLLMQCINEAYHLDLRNYVLVDFSMFQRLVDQLGGVTVRMSAAEISAANDNIAGLNKQRGVSNIWEGFIYANAGNVGLTGQQALAYARIRKIDSDFTRTNRQFMVLNAIYAKFRSKTLLEQYDLLYDILPLVETDLTELRIMELAVSALSMNTSGLLHETFPAEGMYANRQVGGSSVLLTDLPATAFAMHSFLFEAAENPDTAEVLSPGASLPPRLFPATPAPTPTKPPRIRFRLTTPTPRGE